MTTTPNMTFRERERSRLASQLLNDTYEQDGALRWKSNDAVIMLDTFADAEVEPPPGQQAARDRYVDEVTATYRQQRAEHGYSAEERAEMRAAFGPNANVVDVVTGKKVRL